MNFVKNGRKSRNLLILLGMVLIILSYIISTMPLVNAATAWAPNTYYPVGAIVTYNGIDYQCIQAHTSLVGWEPPNVPALWISVGPAVTPTPSVLTTPTATNTPTVSVTNTNTPTLSGGTPTVSNTNTPTPSNATPTATNTSTPTPTASPATGIVLSINGLVLTWTDSANGNDYHIYKNGGWIAWSSSRSYSLSGANIGDTFYVTNGSGSVRSNTVIYSGGVSTPTPTLTLMVTPTSSVTASPGTNPSLLRGSFVQPWLIENWSAANFAAEFAYMKNAKINDHLIWQWTVDSKNKFTYYPSTLSGYTQHNSSDAVGISLAEAKNAGLTVWLGLNWTDDWWSKGANDSVWLINEFNLSKQIAQDLWNRYQGLYANQIAGFYLTMELDNVNFTTTAKLDLMKQVYKDVADYIHANMNKPVMVAPFFNESIGQNAAQYADSWKYILETAPLDVIALQDGIGVGHCTVAAVGAWFSAFKNAIAQVRPSTQLWSDLETLTPGYTSAPTSRIIDQINAEKNYVEKFTSFSFNHYQSPQQGFTTLYNEYKAYADSQP